MANLKRVTSLVTEPITSDYHKVPTFATDVARDAAIPTPVVGMLIYNTNSGACQQYNGTWSTIAPAPSIDATSGLLNTDTDSTITVFGANFTASSILKMFDAVSGGSQIGSNATTTYISATTIKGVFGAGSIPAAGTAVYIEVDNVGATSRFATAITVNADPTVTHAGATGTGSNTTTHLGTYGGAGVGGSDEVATKLLLNFDRGGGLEVEDSSNTGGTGHRVNDSGGNHEHIVSSPFGDGKTAIKFDGSGDQLYMADHADWDLGAVCTIEFWINFTTFSGNTWFGNNTGGNQGATGWGMFFQSNGLVAFGMSSNLGTQNNVGSPTGTIKLNTWHHVAFVRTGANNYGRLYVDGVAQVLAANGDFTISNIYDAIMSSTMPVASGARLDIWGYQTAPSAGVGYIDEFRIVVGAAVYTGNFEVPTARFSGSGQSAGAAGSNIAAVTAAQTKLLITSNLSSTSTSFADSATTGTTHTVSVSGHTKHSTLYNGYGTESTVILPAMTWPASGKTWGSYGALFDGTTDHFNVVAHASSGDLNLDEGGTWTLDCWIYRMSTDSNSHYLRVMATNVGSNPGWSLNLNGQPSCRLRFGADAGGNAVGEVAATRIDQNTWYHVAVTGSGGTLRMYLNGTLAHTQASPAAYNASNIAFLIGGRNNQGSTDYNWHGYIDSIRISNTVRWTSNFTPPTKVYGAVESQTIPTITLTGTATQLAADEDIEFTSVVNPTKAATNQHLTDSGIGLALTNLTGGDKNKATLTGTIASGGGTTHTNMAVKAQVRKSLGDAAYNNSTLVTFSGSTTTVGLAPGMPLTGTGISVAGPLTCGLQSSTTVTAASTTGLVVGMQVNAFTGVPAGATIVSINANVSFVISAAATATDADAKLTFNTIISAVASATTLTLSNVTTGGSRTAQTLIFEDLTRVAHVNGTEVFDGTQAMMTLATGVGGDPVLFNARRYIGTATAQSITGFGFQPDLIWVKRRDSDYHEFCDSVRGPNKALWVNETAVEAAQSQHIMSFETDGVRLGTGATVNVNNASGIIAWGFKAGGTPSSSALSLVNGVGAGTIANGASGVTNLTSLTQTVNQTSGFSITKFEGHSSGGAFPHNLGGTPAFIIVKNIDAAQNWTVWHQNLTATSDYHLVLNTDVAEQGNAAIYPDPPTSTLIKCGTAANNGGQAVTIMCYAWKAVAGVSAFGTYTGNGGGGAGTNTITYTGSNSFTARFILIKRTDAQQNWMLLDGIRNGGAEWSKYFYANAPNAEGDTSLIGTTPTSTGFTFDSGTTWDTVNQSGAKYIYIAFA